MVRNSSPVKLLMVLLSWVVLVPSVLATEVTTSEAGDSALELEYPLPPEGKALKGKVAQSAIYQQDISPLGNRSPLLFVHGGNGERQPLFRWDKVLKRFEKDPDFKKTFKVFLMRYDSNESLKVIVPQCSNAIVDLYEKTGRRPITVMALSLGGNVMQGALLDPRVDKCVDKVVAMATPFHGSPLFSSDWFVHSIYKNKFHPLSRVVDNLDYRIYFSLHPAYQKELRWDNFDRHMPQTGSFKSRLPFGPKGDLTVRRDENTKLAEINKKDEVNKYKFVTFAGYLVNPYITKVRGFGKRLEHALLGPYRLFALRVPAQLGRENQMLKVMGNQIAQVEGTEGSPESNQKHRYYSLNDGLTPVSSALYLPPEAVRKHHLLHEDDIPGLHKYLDVRFARVFRNIDHVTFVDGATPHRGSNLVVDKLHPEQGRRHIFDWMLSEIMHNHRHSRSTPQGKVSAK